MGAWKKKVIVYQSVNSHFFVVKTWKKRNLRPSGAKKCIPLFLPRLPGCSLSPTCRVRASGGATPVHPNRKRGEPVSTSRVAHCTRRILLHFHFLSLDCSLFTRTVSSHTRFYKTTDVSSEFIEHSITAPRSGRTHLEEHEKFGTWAQRGTNFRFHWRSGASRKHIFFIGGWNHGRPAGAYVKCRSASERFEISSPRRACYARCGVRCTLRLYRAVSLSLSLFRESLRSHCSHFGSPRKLDFGQCLKEKQGGEKTQRKVRRLGRARMSGGGGGGRKKRKGRGRNISRGALEIQGSSREKKRARNACT